MSKTKVPSVPEVPPNVDSGLRRFLDAVRQVIQVREGDRGDILDSAVTFRDLVEGGLASYTAVGPSNISIQPTAVTDLTQPPLIVGLTSAGALASIVLSWIVPEYKNHSHTEIWRAQINDINQAAQVGMASGGLYIDYVARNTTGFQYYYWARNVSIYGIKGEFGIAGVLGETSPDPTAILELLLGELTESSLADALNSRIDLIDNGGTTTETVDQRINSATTVINNTLDQFEQSVNTTTTLLSQQIGQVQTNLTDTTNQLTAADTALLQNITSYKAEVANTYATITSVNSALATTNQSIANLNTTLTARLNNAGGTGISVEQQFTAQAGINTGLLGQYTVKINNTTDKYVTGFGLAQTSVNGVTVGEFAIVADRFSIAPVATSPTAADGSPFYYITAPTTINGVTVPAGAYMKKAFIADATIGTAQIADAAITNAKVANLSADKITFNQATGQVFNAAVIKGGTISGTNITGNNITGGEIAGSRIRVGGTVQYPNVEISDVTNSLRSYSEQYINNQPIRYTQMTDGDVTHNFLVPTGGGNYEYFPTKSLTNVYTGIAANAEVVFLPGIWETQPSVIVSLNSLKVYESTLNSVDQSVVCSAENLQRVSNDATTIGYYQYKFTPVAYITASASDGNVPVRGQQQLINQFVVTYNYVNIGGVWNSSIFKIPANVASGYISLTTNNWLALYRNGESDVYGVNVTVSIVVNGVQVLTFPTYSQSYSKYAMPGDLTQVLQFKQAIPAGSAVIRVSLSAYQAINNSSNAANSYRDGYKQFIQINEAAVRTSTATSLAQGTISWIAIGR